MGYFNSIDLINFRNFKDYSISFSKNCNVFYGKNGSGKTNILEGISLLTKGRGLRKDKLANIIKKNCDKFIIKSDFKSEEVIIETLSCFKRAGADAIITYFALEAAVLLNNK